jgi:hypothetical protein
VGAGIASADTQVNDVRAWLAAGGLVISRPDGLCEKTRPLMFCRHFRYEVLAIWRKLTGQCCGWRCKARNTQRPVACRSILGAIYFFCAEKISTKLRKRSAKFGLLQHFGCRVMRGRLPLPLTA